MVWGGTNPGVLGTFSKFWPRSALDSTLLAICNWRIRVDSSRNQCFSTSPSVRNWRRLKLLNLKQDHDFEVVSLSLQNSTTNKKTRLKSLLRVFFLFRLWFDSHTTGAIVSFRNGFPGQVIIHSIRVSGCQWLLRWFSMALWEAVWLAILQYIWLSRRDVESWYPIFRRFTPARWWGEPQGEASWCEKAGPFDTISVIEIWNYPHAE